MYEGLESRKRVSGIGSTEERGVDHLRIGWKLRSVRTGHFGGTGKIKDGRGDEGLKERKNYKKKTHMGTKSSNITTLKNINNHRRLKEFPSRTQRGSQHVRKGSCLGPSTIIYNILRHLLTNLYLYPSSYT